MSMTYEEGFELVKYYVTYYWRSKKFYSLSREYELEDLIQEVMLKFLRTNHFEKFNPEITSKKYHVMRSVMTCLVDLLRKQREAAVSLEEEVGEEGLTVGDRIEDTNMKTPEESYISEETLREMLAKLPESRSKVSVQSPILGQVTLGVRSVFAHLALGWTPQEIAELFGVTTGRIYLLRKEINELIVR
jgi:RNA polymerase sigma factor (sigma-70 family)